MVQKEAPNIRKEKKALYLNNIILITRPHERVKIINSGILCYEGNAEGIPPEYHGDWIEEIYPQDNAIVIEL